MTTPTLTPFWKNSTLATVPSGSEAVAESVSPAGEIAVVPSAGLVRETVGGRLACCGVAASSFEFAPSPAGPVAETT